MSINCPKVTILIPCYNHKSFVKEAIDSAVNQDYNNKRIVIVDDCSPDNSFDYIKSLMDVKASVGNSYIGFINNVQVDLLQTPVNQKQGAARNLGIKHVWDQTDIYALLDADDISYFNRLSETVKKFHYGPEVGLVCHDYDVLHMENNVLIRGYNEPYSKERLDQECIVFSNALISKKALKQVGLFDETLSPLEDYDMWMRITEHFTCVHVPLSLSIYRVNKSSNSSLYTSEQDKMEKYKRMREKQIQRLNQP